MAFRVRVLGICFAAALASSALALAAPAGAMSLSTSPALYPAFDAAVTDYVIRCTDGTPVDVTVSALGTQVDVDGQGPRSGNFTTSVSLAAGRSFRVVETNGTTNTYYVRCLPSDFPGWTYQRFSDPQAEWYEVAPFARTTFQPIPPGVSGRYSAIFDANGVPVWWYQVSEQPLDFHTLTNGNFVWLKFTSAGTEERGLDGSLVRNLGGIGPGIVSDEHETLLLPNGNYLLITERNIPGYSF